MDYETQVLTAELDNYREDLVKAFDYLHENPYHTYVKMPYAKETSELLQAFSIDSEKVINSRYSRTYDQQAVYEQLVQIFTNSASNISGKNAAALSGYVADILNESYKSEFFNPRVFNLEYSIWFETPNYHTYLSNGNHWHIDGIDEGFCTNDKLSMLYPLKGPSTLFFDTVNLIKGFKNGLEYPNYLNPPLSGVQIYHSENINYLGSLNFSPTEIQYGSQGYANIHNRDNSAHSWPVQLSDRVILNIDLKPKQGELFKSESDCRKSVLLNPDDTYKTYLRVDC